MYLSRRNGLYYIWYKDEKGKKQKVSTHCRKKADAFEALKAFQTSKHISPQKNLTLSEFYVALRVFLTSTYRSSTVELYKRSWDNLIRITGDIRLSGLTAYHFDQYKSCRIGFVGGTRVNIELRTLRAALGIAVRWKMLDANPFSRQLLVPIPRRVPAVFTPEQIRLLLKSRMVPWLRDLIIVAILTGMRRDEMLNMRWSQVDLKRGLISIENTPNFKTKTGRMRVIPINRVLLRALLEMSRNVVCEYVIHQDGQRIKGYIASIRFKRLIRKLDLPGGLHLQSLRHSFATWLALDGASIYQISKLLGHSDVRVTEQFYAHLQPEHLQEVVDRIGLSLKKRE
jgi:integrase